MNKILLFCLLLFYSMAEGQSSNGCSITYNQDIISYLAESDYQYNAECFNFTIDFDNWCCDKFYDNNECLVIYSHCLDMLQEYYNSTNPFNTHNNNNCHLRYRLQHDECHNMVVDYYNWCCVSITDNCQHMYNLCINITRPDPDDNILSLFNSPINGYSLGLNLMVYYDILTPEECAHYCMGMDSVCKSFDYLYDMNQCYLSNHILSDNITLFFNNTSYKAEYYERIFQATTTSLPTTLSSNETLVLCMNACRNKYQSNNQDLYVF